MLRKALDSDLLSGRKDGGCYISFNWLFNPKNYEPLMEGTFDNPTIAASAEKKPSKPQQKKTPSPPSSDDSLSIGERWKLAQQSQQSAEAYRDKVNRSIILGAYRQPQKASARQTSLAVARKILSGRNYSASGHRLDPTCGRGNEKPTRLGR